ncbi:AP2 domain transcription factor AP2X-11 [Babesia ovata]|uniref:AP2 domain transcription factor AP2X-11 n=1 Tax=Babesia ovata TaxID=189622 RepID=A0A2H6KGE5_9APIC|nr:AP2 domain transcription factor AP2X-11 [Babesia ovata]GBE62068.1 AP2 domain transcription factor AP2X-11 [Babesia ovata]
MYDPSGNYNSSYGHYGVSGHEAFAHHASGGVYSVGVSSMESNGSVGNLLKCIKTWQSHPNTSVSSAGSVKDLFDNVAVVPAGASPCYPSQGALQTQYPLALSCHPASRVRSNSHHGHGSSVGYEYQIQDQHPVQVHMRSQLQVQDQCEEYEDSLEARPVVFHDAAGQSQQYYSHSRHPSPVCGTEVHCSQVAHSETYSSHSQSQALAPLQCQVSQQCLHRSPVQVESAEHVNVGAQFTEPMPPTRAPKRRAQFADHSVDTRAVYHDVSDSSGSTMMLPRFPALEGEPPAAKRAYVSTHSYAHPEYEQHASVAVNKRPAYSLAVARPTSISSRAEQLTHMYADADDLASGRRLVYLGNVDVIGDERIMEGESNPFLDAGGRVVPNTIITPRDILVYGRRGSFTYGDRPFTPDSDPRAATLLKDVTVNCQYDRVRMAETPPPQPHVMLNSRPPGLLATDKYAQMASQVEKVRGVCYCRSDNSWTAWWTEKGRNRKKAYKISRYGFYEARRLAIEHRRSVYRESGFHPQVEPLNTPTDSFKRMVPESMVTEITPDVSTSAATPTSVMSPVTLPAGVVTAMNRTRVIPGHHDRSFQVAVTDVESPVVRGRPTELVSAVTPDDFNQETAPTPTLDSCDVNAVNGYDGNSYCAPEVHTPVRTLKDHASVAAWVPGKEGDRLDDMFKRRVMSACTTADSSEFGAPKAEELTPNMVSLHHDISGLLKLDEASVHNVKMAISSLAYGVEDSRVPSGPGVTNM